MMSLMQGRRAARKFALLALYQLESTRGKLPESFPENKTLVDLLRLSAQALSLQAQDAIEKAAETFKDTSEAIMELEFEHPTNLNSPMGAKQVAVDMPSTQDTLKKLDSCLLACEWLWDVINIPQMLLHATDKDVEQYTVDIVNLVCKHNIELSEKIDAYAEDWSVERLVKMDRLILKVALTEMYHRDDIDTGVAVNEAIELAKLYSMPDSYKFINGILGKVALTLNEPKSPASSIPTLTEAVQS